MNIFVIPSWYPSADYPISGNFVQEQTEALCKAYSNINVGISIWGQQDERYLLWAKDHFKNFAKVYAHPLPTYKQTLAPNLVEYYSNTYTWSRSLFKGNLKSIIKANIRNIKQFEASFGPVDVLHGHLSPFAGDIIRVVSDKTGIPYCLTEHNPPFPCPGTTTPSGQLKKHYRTHYDAAAATIAISTACATLLKQQGVKRIKLIPNHLDHTIFKPSLGYISSETFTFLTLAHLTSGKGIHILLEAVALFVQNAPATAVLFKIAGDGATTDYKATAKRLNIEDKLLWVGEVTRQQALLQHQQCNAFVLPSLYENLPVVLLEAIACGKPVIATRCGGPENIVTPANGLLVEKNNPEELAQAMLHIVNNYNQYESNVIRQDFLERFSSKAVLPQIYTLYQEIITHHTCQI